MTDVRNVLRRARNLLSHPKNWDDDTRNSREALMIEIDDILQSPDQNIQMNLILVIIEKIQGHETWKVIGEFESYKACELAALTMDLKYNELVALDKRQKRQATV